MRQFEPPPLHTGEIRIADLELDAHSRDDIPQLLRGLQYLYVNPTLRAELFQILDEMIPPALKTSPGNTSKWPPVATTPTYLRSKEPTAALIAAR